MKEQTTKSMREARRRLALSRQYADPATRHVLDRMSIEAATKEYVRREEMGAQARDELVNRLGVQFTLGQRAYFCPSCLLVMERVAYEDAFHCLSCKLVRRRGMVLDICPYGFPDVNGRMVKAEAVPARHWWHRMLDFISGDW